MATRYFGQPILRNEDARLLTGQALFTDDVHLPGMLHVAFYRSPYAHARIKAIDTRRAAAMPGVVAVYTAADLGEYWRPGPLLVPPPPVKGIVFNPRTQVPLAKGKVRFVGEPVAVVVAASRYQAEDAAEQIFMDVELLPAVVDLEQALAGNAALVHDDLDANVNAHVIQRKGDYEQAAARADVVIRRLEELNPADDQGNRKVVINAVGFPTTIRYQFSMGNTGLRFANLMRTVTYLHGGAFIALQDI